jgi:hypothetical protein
MGRDFSPARAAPKFLALSRASCQQALALWQDSTVALKVSSFVNFEACNGEESLET